jgi:Ca2+:H+ antiporter
MSDQPADLNIDIPLRDGGRPAEPFRWHISQAIRRTLFGSYINVLLVFVPIGIAAGTFSWPAEAVFVLNFLAIIPLAPVITFSIDRLSPSVGHAFGELIKPTSSNAVEMIVRCLYPNIVVWFALF